LGIFSDERGMAASARYDEPWFRALDYELANDEMGVYVRVWLLMYATGGPITIEKLRSRRSWDALVGQLFVAGVL
jgi:hypothetical protein